ncbi:MAG: CoA-binding protein [Bacteroidota bacterium]
MCNTLVFGASLKSNRYANLVIHRLRENEVSTFAFGIRAGSVADVAVVTSVADLPKIDIITLYLGLQCQKEYYQTIVDLNPKKVIFNPGTENPEFYTVLQNHHIEVEVACTLVLLATGQY